MKAIILAAGVGRRLGDIADNRPKCLLEFAGKSLLQRHLEILRSLGISEIVVTVGYQADQMSQALNSMECGTQVRTMKNPDYLNGSIVSLWTAAEYLRSGDDILLMDADVLYDYRLLKRLIESNIPNCFLLDRDFEPGDEPVKICLRDDQLVEFRKQIPDTLEFDKWGESVGFFRFSGTMAQRLSDRTETYIHNGMKEEHYEEAIRDLLLERPADFGYEDVTGLPWIEIDFPEDVRKAECEILRRIATPA